jgi:hypothetical protein
VTLIKDPTERVDGETERVVQSTYVALGKGNECWIVVARGAFAFRFGPYTGPEAGAILERCVKERIAASIVMQCGPEFDWEIARDIGMKLVLPQDRVPLLGRLLRLLARLRRSAT